MVGWEQSYNPNEQIEAELTQTESGLIFQGAHPLLTLENMFAIMPDAYGYKYPQWENNKAYREGDKVRHANNIYKATADNIGEEPTETGESWKVFNMLSDYLADLTRKGIDAMVQTFIQTKRLNNETRNLLENRTFFDGSGRINATVENRHKLVGFEINPVRGIGVTTKIERIGLQMVGGVGVVKLYLFNTQNVDPVKTFELEFTKTNGGFQWFNVDAFLPYLNNDVSGGSWFLVYDQDELPQGMQAINVSKDWSREPCGTCNIGSVQAWRELTKYLQISPFMVGAPTTFAQFPELWDMQEMMYTNTYNYGLNVEVSVQCDLTDFIVQQRHIFATALQKQVAAIALRTLAMNPNVRVNRNQSNASRMDILYELDGNTAGRKSGIGYELENAYKALSLDTRGISSVCLPCANKGVNYRVV